jgi:hypothetical protein
VTDIALLSSSLMVFIWICASDSFTNETCGGVSGATNNSPPLVSAELMMLVHLTTPEPDPSPTQHFF